MVAAHLVALQIPRLHVGHRPRELDVGQKQGAVVAAGLPLVVEQGVEDVCLERVMRRGEILDERPTSAPGGLRGPPGRTGRHRHLVPAW